MVYYTLVTKTVFPGSWKKRELARGYRVPPSRSRTAVTVARAFGATLTGCLGREQKDARASKAVSYYLGATYNYA